jgi:hypothetical protein
MLYVGVFGIILGTAFGHHFTSANIAATALAAAGWVWTFSSVEGHGLLHATRDALFLTWSLEAGLFFGLVLCRLVFQRRPAVAQPPTRRLSGQAN